MPSTTTFGRRGLTVPDSLGYTGAAAPAAVSPPPTGLEGPLWLLFSFRGRITRLPYWLGQIGLFILYRIIATVSLGVNSGLRARAAAHLASQATLLGDLVAMLVLLGALAMCVWIGLALVVKRWHDRDRSWPWALLGLVPLIGWTWQLIECGFLEGTLGPNRFGPSPKGIMGVTYGDALAETFS